MYSTARWSYVKETQDLITAFRGGHCSGGFIGVVFCQVRTSSNSAPPRLRPYFSSRKGWSAQSGWGSCPKWRSLGILFMSEGWAEKETERWIGAESASEAVQFSLPLRDEKRWEVQSFRGPQSRAAAPLHLKKLFEVALISLWCLLGETNRHVHKEEAWGSPKRCWRDHVSQLALRHLVVLLNELEEVAGERSFCLSYCLVTQLQKIENISQCDSGLCVKSEKIFYLKPQPAS